MSNTNRLERMIGLFDTARDQVYSYVEGRGLLEEMPRFGVDMRVMELLPLLTRPNFDENSIALEGLIKSRPYVTYDSLKAKIDREVLLAQIENRKS